MATMRWIQQLNRSFRGKTSTAPSVLKKYSRDASIFEVRPQAVVYPKTDADLCKLVDFVRQNKSSFKTMSLTARSAGTDMSGGAINDSIVIDFTKHFTHIGTPHNNLIKVEPGAYYRRFEKRTLAHQLIMPSYPASKAICAIGGIVANNAGGEKTLRYGKTIDYVHGLKVILSDGKVHHLGPLSKEQLADKLKRTDFEGEIYNKVYRLIEKNYDAINAAKPKVSKNSTAYNVWDVWDKQTFDLSKLFVGSQGTLGLISEVEFKLVRAKPYTGMLVIYMKDLRPLGELITTVLPTKPDSFEVFDDHSLVLAIKFFFSFWKILGVAKTIALGFQFLPDVFRLRRGIPKLVALTEFEGESPEEVRQAVANLEQTLKQSQLDVMTERAENAKKSARFWLIRRESFNLLRHNVKDKHSAPFIDDLIVPPRHLPEFLPRLQKILDDSDIIYTIAGHVGDGNFHIIPLMDLREPRERAKIHPIMVEVNKLVLSYGGSISGEHNDGLIRGTFLEEMYGPEMMKIFREIKQIFDAEDIFNPHKKTEADWNYSMAHMKRTL